MGIFGKSWQERQAEMDARTNDALMQFSMVSNGWMPHPANASEEDKERIFNDVLTGKPYTLYPPNYVDESLEPVVTEGKLIVEPEPPEKQPWWKRW